MAESGKRAFDKEALTWDDNPVAVERSRAVADAMIREVQPTGDMDALDFGAGTGLVTLALQPYVKSITAADSSQGMLSVLQGKIEAQGLTNAKTLLLDLEENQVPDGCFDFISTTMTMHHMPDVPKVLHAFYRMLRPGGVAAIADLDAEDGSFHPDNTGIHHFGFDRAEMQRMLEEAGFRDIKATTSYVMKKEVEGQTREYPVFLIIGRRL